MLKRFSVFIALTLLLGFANPQPVAANSISQWAIQATANSEYSSDQWSAAKLVGPPDVYPRYGDINGAWAAQQARQNSDDLYIELTYEQAVVVEYVDIYETYNPGAVVKIELIDSTNTVYGMWRGVAEAAPKESRVFRIANSQVNIPVNRVRIYLDGKAVPGYNEIDAVGLTGRLFSTGDLSSSTKTFEQLDYLLDSLEQSIYRAKAGKAADPVFLGDLEGILAELQALQKDLEGQIGRSETQWDIY